MNKLPTQLVLASASPRRAELLRRHGYRFIVCTGPHDEPPLDEATDDPAALAESTAWFKARSAADAGARGVILAADTVVVLDGRLYGKPRDAADARRILIALRGTTHDVYTGLALLDTATSRRLLAHDRTVVTTRSLPDDALERYISSQRWFGKAGAYGIQDADDPFVESIRGSFTNVVGLPVERLAELLAELGYAKSFIDPGAAPPSAPDAHD